MAKPAAFLFALLAALAWPGADAAAADIRLSGLGVRKCGEWTAWKAGNNGEARATALAWAQGFISGHNVYARLGRDNAPSVMADDRILVTLLDSYCEKTPEARIFSGVIEITQSLGGVRLNLAPKAPAETTPKPDAKGPRES